MVRPRPQRGWLPRSPRVVRRAMASGGGGYELEVGSADCGVGLVVRRDGI